MSKIKRVISLLLITGILMSTGVAASAEKEDFSVKNNDLFLDAVSDSGATVYNTVEVTREDFVIKAASQLEIVYPEDAKSRVYCDITSGTVRFGQLLVKNGDHVKKGDPVAEVSVNSDPDKIKQLQFRLDTLQESLDSYVDTNKALLKKYRNIIDSPNESASARHIAQLLYDRLSVEYNNEYTSRSAELIKVKNQLSEAENMTGTVTIKATIDGTITYTTYFRPGQNMDTNSWNYYYNENNALVIITDTSQGQIKVNSNSELLRYNMPVKVLQTKKNISMSGRVITCNSTTLSPSLSSSQTIIEIDGDIAAFDPSEDVTMQFESVSAQDVLLVKKTAVHSDSRGNYVFVLRDGNSCKQYIVSGGTNDKNCWVIQGLEEGDSVIIK